MKTYLFQSCAHCWIFQICCHIECSTFTPSSFRIWNNWNFIASTSFVHSDLSKARLTSHSRMSASRWVITPSWWSGSWRSFLYSSSVYSCHLFLISSTSVRSIPFLFFIVPVFAWNVPLVSNFLEEISSLSHSVVFLYFFALIAEEGFLLSSCYSLELCIQMLISFLFSFAFHFSQLFVKPPQRAILLFCISFPWGRSWSLSPVQCHEPLSIVHQPLYLSDLVP